MRLMWAARHRSDDVVSSIMSSAGRATRCAARSIRSTRNAALFWAQRRANAQSGVYNFMLSRDNGEAGTIQSPYARSTSRPTAAQSFLPSCAACEPRSSPRTTC